MALHMRTWKWVLCGVLLIGLCAGFISVACETSTPAEPDKTQQPPANLSVSVQLNQEGTFTTAIFRGGFGQTLLKNIKMELTTPDGVKSEGELTNVIGDTAVLKGSGCGDMVTGTAYFMNGMSYVILNEKMEFIVGICPADKAHVSDPCAEIAASPSLKPDQIQEIPANKSVIIQTNVDVSLIEVMFRGGFGQNLIKNLDITRVGPDGSQETKKLGNRVGDQVTFTGTNNCMDRVYADVSFIDGTMYHFYDEVIHISRLSPN